MEKIFKLKENGTTVRTEIVAGLTTFMTMAYIIALNPNLLTGFGAEGQNLWNGVFLATNTGLGVQRVVGIGARTVTFTLSRRGFLEPSILRIHGNRDLWVHPAGCHIGLVQRI